MGFRITVRQHFQAALERETKADSQVITKKQLQSLYLLLLCLSVVLGTSVQGQYAGEVGRGRLVLSASIAYCF